MKAILHLWEIWGNYLEIASVFWFSNHSARAYLERTDHCYTWCDHRPWSGSLCGVAAILWWVVHRRVKVTHSMAHCPLRPIRSRGIFYDQNAAYWWIEIHAGPFRYDNPQLLGLQSTSLFTSQSILPTLTTSPALSITPSVLYLMRHISLPPTCPPSTPTAFISVYSSSSPQCALLLRRPAGNWRN